MGRGVRQGYCLSPILSNLYCEYLTKEALVGSGEFKIGKAKVKPSHYRPRQALSVPGG
jgi:hypothetical protein